MKQIDISTPKYPNTFTMVDDADFEWLDQWKWNSCNRNRTAYVERKETSRSKAIHMHRLILGITNRSILVDHRDGNGLNNQRSNLRKATNSENTRNQQLRHNSFSGYKGVTWSRRRNKWEVNIRFDGILKKIGRFTCLIKAAKAYDAAATKYHGEFARLNFPA